MKVLLVVASLNPKWGGPVQVVKNTTEILVRMGVDITIFSPVDKHEIGNLIYPKGTKVRLFKRNFLSRFWTGFSFNLIKSIRKDICNFDVVHIHEIWHFPQYIASKLAGKNNIPYVVTVHGALSSFALKIKPVKKRIFGRIIEKEILKKASGVQAITKAEIEQIKNFEIMSKVKLIYNGISDQGIYSESTKSELFSMYPELKNNRIILYLGRIDRIKGLDILAESFKEISGNFDNVYLIIGGSDFGYKNKLKKLLMERKILDRVIFPGDLSGKLKMEVLNNSDIFVLPSYSEAFSIAVLEAILYKLPVIITHNCNFPEIEDINAGILVEHNSLSLTKALMKMLSDVRYKEKMGNKGREFVLKYYTWDKIVINIKNWYELVVKNEKSKSEKI